MYTQDRTSLTSQSSPLCDVQAFAKRGSMMVKNWPGIFQLSFKGISDNNTNDFLFFFGIVFWVNCTRRWSDRVEDNDVALPWAALLFCSFSSHNKWPSVWHNVQRSFRFVPQAKIRYRSKKMKEVKQKQKRKVSDIGRNGCVGGLFGSVSQSIAYHFNDRMMQRASLQSSVCVCSIYLAKISLPRNSSSA